MRNKVGFVISGVARVSELIEKEYFEILVVFNLLCWCVIRRCFD
jgi:hypothetical protein